MSAVIGAVVRNCEPVRTSDVPVVQIARFRSHVIERVNNGARLAALCVLPGDVLRMMAVLADDDAGTLEMLVAEPGERYDALTPECVQAHWFEREIYEQWRIEPAGHPWLKPIRFHAPWRAVGSTGEAAPLPGVTNYFRVEGEDIHEVAVGPVHAGIIEPGHFRFQCDGERVLHLEIELGYQHRGIERRLIGGPDVRTVHYMETAAGDSTIAHTLAYCQAYEALSGCTAPPHAQVVRGLALELERLANHTGDLGALANDVAYLPTASFCGRLRGDFLNLSAAVCGSRFGRGLVRPGGVLWEVEAARAEQMATRLEAIARDVRGAAELLWNTPSVLDRFEGTGKLTREQCEEVGLVGVAARACGVARDVRYNFPTGIYRLTHVPVATFGSGDVFARAYVRWIEIQRSVEAVREYLKLLAPGAIQSACGTLQPERLVVSLTEGWRGEVCHIMRTDADGGISAYKIVDPSFHNWIGLALAMRGEEISNFPLCNKSFNLSYCGHDL